MELIYQVVTAETKGKELGLSMAQQGKGTYVATVGAEDLEASLDPPSGKLTTLRYYIQAVDRKGNRSWSSEDGVTIVYCAMIGFWGEEDHDSL